MTQAERIRALGDAVRDAVAGTLDAFAPGIAEVAEPEVAEVGDDVLDGVDPAGVIAHAPPADGATGPAMLVLTVAGARRLAAVLGAIDEEEAEFGGGELGDRELGAVREAMTKATGAVGSAVTAVADRDAAFRPASVRGGEAAELSSAVEPGSRGLVVRFELLGEPGRFVLLLPSAIGAEPRPTAAPAGAPPVEDDMPLSGALRSVNVRVWAELGRTRMPTGQVVGLPAGAIVELDRDAEDAVDLYVDGQHYATGRLVVTDDDSWGVRIERVLGVR